jgi:hypothetical protein
MDEPEQDPYNTCCKKNQIMNQQNRGVGPVFGRGKEAESGSALQEIARRVGR